jgi:hypothetical protein
MKRLIVTLTLALTLGLIIVHLSGPGMAFAGLKAQFQTAMWLSPHLQSRGPNQG